MKQVVKEESGHRYIEQGEGPVLLVLHGLFGALSNFQDVLEEFSKDYKVVIPIMPIYELPLLKTNVKELAAYVHEFVVFKNFSNLTLLGNSLGGHVSLVYSVAHPEKVKALVLTGSSGLYENAFGGSFPRREDREYIKKKVEDTFYDPANATDTLIEEVFEIINDRNKLIRVLAIAKSAIRHNMKDDLPSITIPTCLIWGKNDGVTPPEVAEEFHELLPNSQLHWIDKCGHAPMMEHPKQFNALLSPWLKKHVLID
ncbi:MAG: alpha/beta hydrolase [Flavobacteriales bacterium]|nr:alpha/beta hydrolase [Flavobacteriales bacterium]